MSSTRSGITLSVILESIINFVLIKLKTQKYKTYDFTKYNRGHDYVFELIEDDPQKGYMTAQLKGIKPGDYIILQAGTSVYRYQVEEIDYYSEPSDMWMALLNQVIVE